MSARGAYRLPTRESRGWGTIGAAELRFKVETAPRIPQLKARFAGEAEPHFAAMTSLSQLCFDNTFERTLPGDPDSSGRRRQVLAACFSRTNPTPVSAAHLLAYSASAAELIGLDASECESPLFVEVFSGNRLLAEMRPYAACYGGHQFGNWAGQLGDGRAITLGEVRTPAGQRWELQLKGAGPTPYSRTADGRAVVRSSVREFLCSEAMHHLGVPTTRALCLIGTGESVVRDMFYDGHPRAEPGAVVCRMAPSFLRFGNFEIFSARKDTATLRALAEYTLRELFPGLGEPSPAAYGAFFAEICRRTATLMAHWMRVGFVHGVMNTDNMSVLGLTLDYGPYGWLDDFAPGWTPNTTDRGRRRYRYAHQPGIAAWNLMRFAEALEPLMGDSTLLEAGLAEYEHTLGRTLHQSFLSKLGLTEAERAAATGIDFPIGADAGEPPALGVELGDGLIDELLRMLQLVPTDMTLFFRNLAELPADRAMLARPDAELLAPLRDAYYAPDSITSEQQSALARWLRAYLGCVLERGPSDAERRVRMHAVNPRYVLRNYLAQLAIDEVERGETGKLLELLEVLRTPYVDQPGKTELSQKRPDWARDRPGCSMLSCSS